MKKLYALLGLLSFIFTLNTAQAQVLVVEDFENGLQVSDFPGWINNGLPPFDVDQTDPCGGLQSLSVNVSAAQSSEVLYKPTTQITTGLDVVVSFDYKIVDETTGNPIPAGTNIFPIELYYSVDGGATWSATPYDTIDQNDLPTADCSNHSFTIPAASLPSGSVFSWRLDINYGTGTAGYKLYIDNFSAVEQVDCIPPVNVEVDPTSITFNTATITWDDLNVPAVGSYDVYWCISPLSPPFDPTTNPTCTGTLGGNMTVTSTTANLTGLFQGTPYYVYVQVNCSPTESVWVGPGPTDPPTFHTTYIGIDCATPIDVTSLPYDHNSQTDLYGFEEYSGSPGTGCGAAGNIMDGYEVVYKYTSPQNDILTIDLTNLTGTNVGVFVYEDCADIGSLCIAGATTTGGGNLNINSLFVNQGEDYYIVIVSSDAQFNPQNTNYDLHIEGFDCATWVPPVPDVNPIPFVVGVQNLGDFSMILGGVNPTIVGATLTWYEDNNGAPGNMITAPLNTIALADLDCYWVTQNIGTCESPALQVCFDEFDCATDLGGITGVTGDSVCTSGTMTLAATSGGDPNNIYWYDSPTGGEAVNVGNTFTTPNLSTTTSYWVTEVFLGQGQIPNQGNVGPTSQNVSSNDDYGVTFQVTQVPFNIQDVQVFATGSGPLTVELLDSSGGTVHTKSFSLTGGTATSPASHTLDLNWTITNTGTYYLQKKTGPGMLYVPSSDTSFPYALGTGAEITDGSDGSSTNSSYYYFFNWTVTGSTVLCEKLPRTQVDAVVYDIIPTTVTADDMIVCIGASTDLHVTSADGDYVYTWTWPGSPTPSPTGADIPVTVTQNTTYTVTAYNPNTTCSFVNDISLEVKGAADLALSPDQELCAGETTRFTAGGLVYDFEQSPTGWTTANNSTTSSTTPISVADWHVVNSPYGSLGISSSDNSSFYITEVNLLGPNATSETILTSPPISMVGVGSASVSFEHYLRYNTNQPSSGTLEINVDNSGWTPLETYNSIIGGTDFVPFQNFEPETVDLSAFVGSTIQLRFMFSGEWGWYWAIDNVIITRNFLSGSVTWSPTTDLYFDEQASIPYAGSPTNIVYFKGSQAGTFTYTATLDIVNCTSATADVVVTVYETLPPTTNFPNQDFLAGDILGDLDVTGVNLSYYVMDANGDLDQISVNTPLVDGTTYYISQTENGCESGTITVTVSQICPTPSNLQVIVAADGDNASQITATWDPPADLAGMQEYRLVITDITDSSNPVVVYDDVVPLIRNFEIVDDLPCEDKTYEVEVSSVCDAANGVYGSAGTVTFTTECLIGTTDFSFEGLSFYPNPTRGMIYFKNNMPIEKISVYGLSGNKVLESEVQGTEVAMDFSRLSSGTYLAIIKVGEATKVVRVIRE